MKFHSQPEVMRGGQLACLVVAFLQAGECERWDGNGFPLFVEEVALPPGADLLEGS